jgi:transposase-like protein
VDQDIRVRPLRSGENGWLRQLTKAILERMLNAELSDDLGYAKT